jgi:hypothetical protein
LSQTRGHIGHTFGIAKLNDVFRPLSGVTNPMKRRYILILAGMGAAALFAGLVHAVLVIAQVAEPAATTVYGMTPGRLWATTAALLALGSVVMGGLALRRFVGHFGPGHGRRGAIVASAGGLIAVINGGLNLAVAKGGPGTGNGVVGGAAALVLGLIAIALGGLILTRLRRYRRPAAVPQDLTPDALICADRTPIREH